MSVIGPVQSRYREAENDLTVTQGSVLGPLLFLLFVNDLPRWIVNSMKMFADDTKL